MYLVVFKSSGRVANRFLTRKSALFWIEDNSSDGTDLFRITKG